MEQSWMSANRLSEQYEKGIKEFVNFAVEHAQDPTTITCPCLRCCYGKRISAIELEDHLVCFGIERSYTCWTKYSETRDMSGDLKCKTTYGSQAVDMDQDMDTYTANRLEEMTNVVEEDLQDCPEMFEKLKSDSVERLYDGCSKFTKLSAVLRLYKLKAGNGWTDRSFTDLLMLLKDMLPTDNVPPNRTYEAKGMLCSIGMSYERIHACPNDCILFRNQYTSLKACPKCGVSRYKNNGSSACI